MLDEKCFSLPDLEVENEDESEEKNEADKRSDHSKRQAVPFPGPQIVAGAPSLPVSQGVAAQLPAVSS